jgi:predicted transcriptional regulator
MAATATIRVSRETRDLLAGIAEERGVSVSALLAEFAHRSLRAYALSSEREATLADAAEGGVAAEEREWQAVLGDGLD